jgi:uncharacterized protein YeaO (DUF488 family)
MTTGGSNKASTATPTSREQPFQNVPRRIVEDDCQKPTRPPAGVQSEVPMPAEWDLDLWLPELAPSSPLASWYANDEVKWSEFARRYRQELEQQAELCERLRQLATERELVLVHDSDHADRNVAAALETHVQFVECQRRWQAGWVIGGHTWPMRHQLRALGGLWYPPHKVWTMPDQTTCQAARRLFPGDF